MEFTISRTNLFLALQKVVGVIPNRSTLQILTNVLIYSENNHLKLVGTDLELTIISSVEAEIKTGGGLVIPAKILNEILKELPEDQLVFSVDNNHRVTVQSKIGEYHISGESQDTYPTPPHIESSNTLTIPNNVFRRMIDKTTFATSTDELRPPLTGVLCHFTPDGTKMVATDGHRLVKIVNSSIQYTDDEEIILPIKALNFLQKNMNDQEKTSLLFDEQHVLFQMENLRIYSKIISGDYPDYERVLPTENDKELHVNSDALVSSVKRISLFANLMTNQIRISLSRNSIEISAKDSDVGGEAKESLACNYGEEDMEIGYNAVYLLDVLRHMDTSELTLKLNDSLTGTLLYSEKQYKDEDLTMLVMPVRLNDK